MGVGANITICYYNSIGKMVAKPKRKIVDEVREIKRLKHYYIHTEHSYRGWVRRYIIFHGMKDRLELFIRGEKNKKKTRAFAQSFTKL